MKKRVCLCTAHRSIFLRSKPFHGPTFFSNAFRSHTVHLPPYHKSHPKNFYRKRSSLLPKFQKHLLRDKKTLRLLDPHQFKKKSLKFSTPNKSQNFIPWLKESNQTPYAIFNLQGEN